MDPGGSTPEGDVLPGMSGYIDLGSDPRVQLSQLLGESYKLRLILSYVDSIKLSSVNEAGVVTEGERRRDCPTSLTEYMRARQSGSATPRTSGRDSSETPAPCISQTPSLIPGTDPSP